MGQPVVIISNPKCAVKDYKLSGGTRSITVCLTSDTNRTTIIHHNDVPTMTRGSGDIWGEKLDFTINPR